MNQNIHVQGSANAFKSAFKSITIEMQKQTYAALKQFYDQTWTEIEATGVECSYGIDGKLMMAGNETILRSAENKIRDIVSKLESMKFKRFSDKLSVLERHRVSTWKGVYCYVDRLTNLKDVYTETDAIMKQIELLMNNPTDSNEGTHLEKKFAEQSITESQHTTQSVLQSDDEKEQQRNDKSTAAESSSCNEMNKDFQVKKHDGFTRLDTQTEEKVSLKDGVCIYVVKNDLDNDDDADVNNIRERPQYARQTSTSSKSTEKDLKDEVEIADEVKAEGGFNVPRGRHLNLPGNPIQEHFNINGIRVVVWHGDILEANADCIVNAANSDLQHNGGIARVIAAAAGKTIYHESDSIMKTRMYASNIF